MRQLGMIAIILFSTGAAIWTVCAEAASKFDQGIIASALLAGGLLAALVMIKQQKETNKHEPN